MSEEELLFTALAELSTRKIAEAEKAEGLESNKPPAKKGGKIAKDARTALEAKTGKSVITGENFLPDTKKQHITILTSKRNTVYNRDSKMKTSDSFKQILRHLAQQDPEEKLRIAFNLWQFARDLQDKQINYGHYTKRTNSSGAIA